MRFVDHDPAAARAAAARCRDAAHRYDRIAGWLQLTPATVQWCGGGRDRVVRQAGQLGDDLRREAATLRVTAARLEAAARAAERREEDLASAAAQEAAAASVCPVVPVVTGPTVAQREARRHATSSSSSSSWLGGSTVPVGVR